MPPSYTKRKSILSYVIDWPNALTLLGLCSGVISISLAAVFSPYLAIIPLLIAGLCDWYDGLLARRMPARTKQHSEFGVQLDSLADLVHSGVAPGFLICVVQQFSMLSISCAVVMAAAGALRLSYFNIHGLDNDRYFRGMPITDNIYILAACMLIQKTIFPTFSNALPFFGFLVAAANVSSIPFKKKTGRFVYVIMTFDAVACIMIFSIDWLRTA